MRREGLSLASCVFLSCLLSLVSRPLFALSLPPQFADGAVFAKNEPIRVFGTASAPVKVTLGDRTATAKPGEDGKFLAELPALPAGGPYELVVESDGTKKTLSDVRIGTVVMIAGQSNAAFSLGESSTPKESWTNDPLVRTFWTPCVGRGRHLPKEGWIPLTVEDAGKWSAIGYHVALELRRRTGEAVGIVNCFQGASVIQAWLPVEIADAEKYKLPDEELFRDHFEKGYAHFNVHGILYKTSFRSFAPYALTHIVWYQGESNTGKGEPKIYAQLVAELIRCWRRDLSQPKLPFTVVQIADTRKSEGWLGIQAAQMKVPELVEGVKVVRSGDVCEKKGIHPPTKDALSRRIAEGIR